MSVCVRRRGKEGRRQRRDAPGTWALGGAVEGFRMRARKDADELKHTGEEDYARAGGSTRHPAQA
jgi:hypothetical protein